MIEIRITDAETSPPAHLAAIARALLEMAGQPVAASPARPAAAQVNESGAVRAGAPGYKIAPNDRPDVGADAAQARAEDDGPVVEPDPAQVFAGAGHADPDPDPATLFGAGNVAAASGSASSATLASTDAGSSNAATGTGAVSGEQGNAGAVSLPSTTPGGTPPAPNNGVATVGASTPANGVELDKHGLPWDGRIHAGTKTKNKDQSWKKKPKVDDATVAQVEAELRHMMSIKAPAVGNPAASTGAVATPPANVPAPPPASAPGNVPPPPGIPTPPASGQTTPGAAASSPVVITGFAQLLPAVTNAVAAGTLTEARVAEVLAAHGVQVLPQLAPRPDLVQSVAAQLFGTAQ